MLIIDSAVVILCFVSFVNSNLLLCICVCVALGIIYAGCVVFLSASLCLHFISL